MNMPLLLQQLQEAVTLYAEILACVVIASVLGCFVGWALQQSRYRKRINAINDQWKDCIQELEDGHHKVESRLEEQMQGLGEEVKLLQANNQALGHALKSTESDLQIARRETTRLNQRNTEAQEQSRRIIQQKDQEIFELANRQNMPVKPTVKAMPYPPAQSASITGSKPGKDTDINSAETIAISPSMLPDVTQALSRSDLNGESSAVFTDKTDSVSETQTITIPFSDSANTDYSGSFNNDKKMTDRSGTVNPASEKPSREEPIAAVDPDALAQIERFINKK